MIDFKPFAEIERKLYEEYLFAETEQCCALSFANLSMWGEQWASIVRGQLIILSNYNGKLMYNFPLGTGDKKLAIEAIIQDSKERNIPCFISSITISLWIIATFFSYRLDRGENCTTLRNQFLYLSADFLFGGYLSGRVR